MGQTMKAVKVCENGNEKVKKKTQCLYFRCYIYLFKMFVLLL